MYKISCLIFCCYFLRRDDLNEKMKKGKNSTEKWQIFQTAVRQIQVREINTSRKRIFYKHKFLYSIKEQEVQNQSEHYR